MKALPYAWFVLLALAVAAPLLGDGHLLLLDFPAGPAFPRLTPLPLPSARDIGNGVPVLALHASLREVSELLPEKALLVSPVAVGGAALYRFVRTRLHLPPLAAAYGGTLFAVNPFVIDRYLAGHLYFLLAYALLPLALGPVFDALAEPTLRRAAVTAAWAAALAAIAAHIAGMYAALVVLAALVAQAPVRLRARFVLVFAAVAALASAYWLLPLVVAAPTRIVSAGDLAVYASEPSGWLVLPTLAALYGFWRDEFARPIDEYPSLVLLASAIVGLAGGGLVALWTKPRTRRFALLAGIGAAAGLLLAAGSSFPLTRAAFRFLFEHVPVVRAYREPQKFVAIVALVYAAAGAAGLAACLARARPAARVALAVAAFGLVGAYGHGAFWGFWGRVELSTYPTDWRTAGDEMKRRGEGAAVVFPWRLYAPWSFSDRRVVASPAPSYFDRPLLVADGAGLNSGRESPDPFVQYVLELLDGRERLRRLGQHLAPLGVRYVLWAREADWYAYRFLSRQEDLVPIYGGRDLVLFENTAWSGDVTALPESGAELRAPLVPRVDPTFPALARPLPFWPTIEADAPLVAVARRCTDGWRLGDTSARCHRGAVAVFAPSRRRDVLWRPAAGANLLGYAISAATVLALALALSGVPVSGRRRWT